LTLPFSDLLSIRLVAYQWIAGLVQEFRQSHPRKRFDDLWFTHPVNADEISGLSVPADALAHSGDKIGFIRAIGYGRIALTIAL
jgi:hypothetical protein